MINIMLVAGDKTDKLAKFFKMRNAFSVSMACESLSSNVAQIKDSIINVNTLLYFYQESSINIRTDMQILKELLSDNNFFTVGEIIFIIAENENSDKAVNYFKAAMSESSFSKYTIKLLKGKPTFDLIYNTVLGVSKNTDFANSYKNIYRVERNDEAKRAFVATDDSNLLIEPFDYSNLNKYMEAQHTAAKVESGVYRKDLNAETNLETFNSPSLGHLKIDDNIFHESTIVVTGKRKTGVSVWATALAASALNYDKPVLLFDLTENGDIWDLLSDKQLSSKAYSVKDLTKLFHLDTDVINICTPTAEQRDVLYEMFQYLYAKSSLNIYRVIIACDAKFVDTLLELVHSELAKVLYCVQPLRNDLLCIQEYVSLMSQKYANKFVLILNKLSNLMPGVSFLSESDIQNLFPFDIAIVKSITFEDFKLDGSLISSILEVVKCKK